MVFCYRITLKPLLTGSFLWAALSVCHAITNIESERLGHTEYGTRGSFSLTLDGREGSSDKFALGLALKLVHSTPKDEWIVLFNRDYAEVDNEVNTDSSFQHVRYLTVDTVNWGHEVYLQHENDEFRSLSARWVSGAGLRYTFTPTAPDKAHSLGLGLMYESENYLGNGPENDEDTWRLNLYWVFRKNLTETADYTSTLYFQPSVEELGDEKGLWLNAVNISVTETIGLSVLWEVKHDTDAPDAVVATESTYKTVLIYHFW